MPKNENSCSIKFYSMCDVLFFYESWTQHRFIVPPPPPEEYKAFLSTIIQVAEWTDVPIYSI